MGKKIYIGRIIFCILISTYGCLPFGLCQKGVIIFKRATTNDAKIFRETVLTEIERKFTSIERKRRNLIADIRDLKSQNDFFINVEAEKMDDDRLSVKLTAEFHANSKSISRANFFGNSEISACQLWAEKVTEDIYYFIDGKGKERKKIAILDFTLDEDNSTDVNSRVKDLKRKIPKHLKVYLNVIDGTETELKSKYNFQIKQTNFSEYDLAPDEEGVLHGYYLIKDQKLVVIVELALRSITDCVMDSIELRQTNQMVMYRDLGQEVLTNWEKLCAILIDN